MAEDDFRLSHEDAKAAQVALRAVIGQLHDEDRRGLAAALYPLLEKLQEYLDEEE